MAGPKAGASSSARRAGRRKAWARVVRAAGELAPKGLYARALIIIIAPIVLLESVVAFTFMERHWNQVTRRLSEGMARDMAAIVDIYEASASKEDIARLIDIAPEPVRLVGGGAAGRQPADAAAQALLRSARPRAVRRDPRQRQAAVLDRHGRPVAARGDPRQARPGDPALRGAARADLRLQLAHLPDVDGGHVGGPADRGDPVPAQPDPARSCGSPRPPTPSARAGPCRTTSARAARARCGRRRWRSWRCATASAITSSSAPPCWPASATTCAPC